MEKSWLERMVGYLLGAFIALSIIYFIKAYQYEMGAIEHGCAQYNSTTGEFEWKEVEK